MYRSVPGLFGLLSVRAEVDTAVILPRVQVHFNLSSKIVGLLSASTMAGVRFYLYPLTFTSRPSHRALVLGYLQQGADGGR